MVQVEDRATRPGSDQNASAVLAVHKRFLALSSHASAIALAAAVIASHAMSIRLSPFL
jgi:hypothetical protein